MFKYFVEYVQNPKNYINGNYKDNNLLGGGSADLQNRPNIT